MDPGGARRSEEHTSELQSPCKLVCRLLLEKKKKPEYTPTRGAISLPARAATQMRSRPAHPHPHSAFRAGDRFPECARVVFVLFFFNDTATTEIYTLSLHDALPI